MLRSIQIRGVQCRVNTKYIQSKYRERIADTDTFYSHERLMYFHVVESSLS